WATAGHAHLIMDTRGQGWSTAGGDTPDTVSLNGDVPGFLPRGVDSPDHHYYRRVYTDAIRFVEAARAHPAVDPDRVVVTGHSLSGSISIAVYGLVPDLVAVWPYTPFLCDLRRTARVACAPPYTEFAEYLSLYRHRTETVLTTLSYVDAALLASPATAPAL